MRPKFSELYWAILFLVVFSLLMAFKNIWGYIKNFLGETTSSGQSVSPFSINWLSWLLFLGIIMIILLGLTVVLWHRQLVIKKTFLKNNPPRAKLR